MELPELRMTFADQAGLAHELQQNLRHGRAFLCQRTEIPVLSECTLVLVHPEREDELRLPAQVVMVNAAGVGVSLASSYVTQLEQLEAFAAPSVRQDTFVPEPPSDAEDLEPEQATVIPGEPLVPADLEPEATLTTWVPEAPSSSVHLHRSDHDTRPLAADSGSLPPLDANDRPTYIPGEPELAAAGLGAPGPVGATTQPPPAAITVPTAAYLEIGEPAPEPEPEPAREPADEASFADVEEELARESLRPGAAPEPATLPPSAADARAADMDALAADDDLPPLEEEELNSDVMTPSGRPVRPVELQQGNKQERLRSLNAAQQLKVARTGELADRIAVERLYGKQVWEALLHNPRLSIPEVARIARKGTVPKPLLEIILDNPGWIKADAVRRALLSNPKLSADAVLKLLRATPKHELKMIEKGTAYGAAVRDSARKLLRQ